MTMKSFLLLSLLLWSVVVSASAARLEAQETTTGTCSTDKIQACNAELGVVAEEDLSEQISAMMGHLRAGLALFEIAEYGMGAPHLMHPIRETSEAQKDVLRNYGFDERAFETLAESASESSAHAERMAQVLSLISSMESLQSRLSSDPYRNVSNLLNLAKKEYGIAVAGNAVADISEYQDAYGFILEAKQQSGLMEADDAAAVLSLLEALEALWIDGVEPPAQPTPASTVARQIAAAIEKLNAIEPDNAR